MALAKRRLHWRLRMTLCHIFGAGYNIKIIESNATSIHKKKNKIKTMVWYMNHSYLSLLRSWEVYLPQFCFPLLFMQVMFSSLNDAYPTHNFSDLNKLINVLAAQHTNQCIEMLFKSPPGGKTQWRIWFQDFAITKCLNMVSQI